MKIEIKGIPHKKQRVGEVGDYWEKKGKTTLVVSRDMPERFQQAVILHELVEYFLVKNRGIKLKDIDTFDKKFYNNKNSGEAGDSEKAPYHAEHLFATMIESLFLKEQGISWQEYSEFINNL